MQNTLPEQFTDLTPWLDWALPTHQDRSARRSGLPLSKVKEFYDALHPRIDEIIRYMSQFKWGEKLDTPHENLYRIGLAYMEAALPVELKWKDSKNEYAFPFERLNVPPRY